MLRASWSRATLAEAAVDIAAGRGVQDDVFRADFRFDRLAQKERICPKVHMVCSQALCMVQQRRRATNLKDRAGRRPTLLPGLGGIRQATR